MAPSKPAALKVAVRNRPAGNNRENSTFPSDPIVDTPPLPPLGVDIDTIDGKIGGALGVPLEVCECGSFDDDLDEVVSVMVDLAISSHGPDTCSEPRVEVLNNGRGFSRKCFDTLLAWVLISLKVDALGLAIGVVSPNGNPITVIPEVIHNSSCASVSGRHGSQLAAKNREARPDRRPSDFEVDDVHVDVSEDVSERVGEGVSRNACRALAKVNFDNCRVRRALKI